jgi:hypothetical protein
VTELEDGGWLDDEDAASGLVGDTRRGGDPAVLAGHRRRVTRDRWCTVGPSSSWPLIRETNLD